MLLETLAKYPFLSDAKKYVKENSISVKEILHDPIYSRARAIGIERLENSYEKHDADNRSIATETDCVMELLSYPIARMIAVCIGDIYFKRRYALGEAVHFYKNLVKEKIDLLIDISMEFNIEVKYDEETDKILIYFTDYLKHAPTRYKEWKMINREMQNGFIKIQKKDLARIIQEALRSKINDELDSHECNSEIKKIFNEEIQKILVKVLKYREKIKTEPIGKLDIDKLPPCMKNILNSIQSGENVPHAGRFALVAFLNSLKLGTEEIMKLFSTAPDFEEEKTRYQVEHITGEMSSTSYKPPGCEKLRTYGICPSEEIDRLCKKVHHPMSYYRIKWKQEKNNKEKKK